ncbi:glycosyltransferase [Candidatus Dependentiae bacterium]|nr:glycosyltransferase [Candidatus Dependentiae bacterium]
MINSKPYKIIFIINGTGTGGAELVLYNIVKNIDKKIFSPEIISLKKTGIIGEKIIKEGIPVKNLHFNGIFDIIFFLKLYIHIKKTKPAIVNTIMFHSDVIGRTICKLAGCKVITSFHNIYIGNNSSETKIREIIIKLTDFLADSCTIISQNAKEYFLKKKIVSDKKLNVILNGIDSDLYKNNFNTQNITEFKKKHITEFDEFIFISAGRFVEYKGFYYLIKAAELLKNKGCKFKIVIAGDGELFDELKKMIFDHSLEKYIILTGNINNLNEWMWCSDAFVMPSLWEGFPCVLLEAMSAGLPVIATNVGGNSEIIENNHTGFLIEPQNEKILSDKMFELMTLDRDKRIGLGQLGKTRVLEHFQISRMVKKYEDLYKKIIEQ